MAVKKGEKVGGSTKSGETAENSEFDVERVAVGDSSTKWGGSTVGGKAKAILRADLDPERNMEGVEEGAPKKNAHMNNAY